MIHHIAGRATSIPAQDQEYRLRVVQCSSCCSSSQRTREVLAGIRVHFAISLTYLDYRLVYFPD